MHDSTYEERKAALIDEIIVAFDGVEREDGVTLHEATAIDNYGSAAERAEARGWDQEKRWQDVPWNDIACTDAVLSFLDAKGFHYYIPAYMVWYLHHMGDGHTDSTTFDSVAYHLSGCYDRKPAQQEWFPLLTLEQKRTIAHFFALQVERKEAWQKEADATLSAWDEEEKQAAISAGMPETEVTAMIEAAKQQRERWRGQNQYQAALDKFWGQFL